MITGNLQYSALLIFLWLLSITMDTEELSSEAYEGIIMEAEKFSRDLTLSFGLLASSCENEQEYLVGAKS